MFESISNFSPYLRLNSVKQRLNVSPEAFTALRLRPLSSWMWLYYLQWRLCTPCLKQSCWINSNMNLLVGTWKLHYSRKRYGDPLGVINLCTLEMCFCFDFPLHTWKLEAVELRECSGSRVERQEGKGWKWEDAPILIKRVHKLRKRLEAFISQVSNW